MYCVFGYKCDREIHLGEAFTVLRNHELCPNGICSSLGPIGFIIAFTDR